MFITKNIVSKYFKIYNDSLLLNYILFRVFCKNSLRTIFLDFIEAIKKLKSSKKVKQIKL